MVTYYGYYLSLNVPNGLGLLCLKELGVTWKAGGMLAGKPISARTELSTNEPLFPNDFNVLVLVVWLLGEVYSWGLAWAESLLWRIEAW